VSPPGHQNAISVVLHFLPSGFLTYPSLVGSTGTGSGYHQSIVPYVKKYGCLHRRKTESVYILCYRETLGSEERATDLKTIPCD